jgi:exosortase
MANDAPSAENVERIDYLAFLKRRWTPLDFAKLLLLAGVCGTIYYFYGVRHVYEGLDIARWAWARYAPQYNFEHGKLVPLIFLFLVWYHREDLIKAEKKGCDQGLIWVAAGCAIYAMGARTLQGRLGMAAAPPLLYGIVLYLWGKRVARILLFPILFLFFMIPVSAIEQATFRLQFMVTGIAQIVCGILGMPLYAEGTTLRPLDQSFRGFDVAEGCSGIRSLMAMVMVTAVYVHLTQTKLWKKLVILFCSTGFAIIGNAGRIISIFLVAKFFGSAFAGGPYHEYSGYVSFPIALGAMLLVSRLLDLPIFDPAHAVSNGPGPGPQPPADPPSYDY